MRYHLKSVLECAMIKEKNIEGEPMKTVLLALYDDVLSERISQQLREQFLVFIAGNGPDALAMLTEVKPDVLLLDLMLPEMDGISVLQEAKLRGIDCATIAITPYVSDYVLNAVEYLCVQCLLRTPCSAQLLCNKVLDLCEMESRSLATDETDFVLRNLGIQLQTKGGKFLAEAIRQYRHNPNQTIFGDLYPSVANAFNATASQVERAMRFAIERAWAQRNDRIWRAYFPADGNGKTVKPTNSAFISTIASVTDAQTKTA